MNSNPLTIRQKEILRLLADGREGKEVAANLGITLQTVKNHLLAMRRQMRVMTTMQALATALRKGWIV